MTQEAVARLVTRVGGHSITRADYATGPRYFVLDDKAQECGTFGDLDAARQFAAEREARR